jgi:hypothetical protein
MQHANTPRMLYIEKESSHTLFDLEALSFIEKIFFWMQKKFLSKNSSVIFLAWRQVIFFHPTVPLPLKKGPVLKTTSVLLELIKILPKHSQTPTSLYYYFHSNLGLWQLTRNNQTLRSHHFIPHTTETLLEDHCKKTLHRMKQAGIKEDIPIINLSSRLSDFLFPYDGNKPFDFHLNFFPSYLHGALAAIILFIGCVTHTIFLINTWENQLFSSRQTLKQMEEKRGAITYQQWKQHFHNQRGL